MKNIILQHWTGALTELTVLSSKSISDYAKMVGAEYELVRGDQFRPELAVRPELQKLIMLDKRWDDYDNVVMVDCDMFVRKGCTANLFECEGIGRHTQIQTNLRESICRNFGMVWGNEGAPYWGGSIWKLTKEQRKKFRSVLTDDIVMKYAHHWVDEGVMHTLANKLGMSHTQKGNYLEGQMWNYSSFESDVDRANFIHIRTKIKQGGPKDTKINNYRRLVERELIDG
jgi:hypothetical protein